MNRRWVNTRFAPTIAPEPFFVCLRGSLVFVDGVIIGREFRTFSGYCKKSRIGYNPSLDEQAGI